MAREEVIDYLKHLPTIVGQPRTKGRERDLWPRKMDRKEDSLRQRWNSRTDGDARWGLGDSWKAPREHGKEKEAELSAEHEVHASNNIFFFCDSVIE